MIRIFSNIILKQSNGILAVNFQNANIIKPINQLNFKPLYNFNMLTERIQKRQNKKNQQQVKKQFQDLANKPTFTLMDYKQRILDELQKLKNSIRGKMSAQNQKRQKQLQIQKKVLSCLYENQLNEEVPLTGEKKKAISLVSQIQYSQVLTILRKANRYQKMHSVLRSLKQNGEPLPQDMNEFNYIYMKSGVQFRDPKMKYRKYQKKSRSYRSRYLKFGSTQ